MEANEPTSALLQPVLHGPTLLVRPLVAADFEPLYAVASDPLLWAQHPDHLRYQLPVFQRLFEGAIASRGALTVVQRATGRIIGSSRYYELDAAKRTVCIGYTFISRDCWGGTCNGELKTLMLAHAAAFADTVWFHVGPNNHRSRRAMEKIGAVFSHEGDWVLTLNGPPNPTAFYRFELRQATRCSSETLASS
jgi:RimJ/RimL family protein N-acetyltransferase